MIYSEPTCSNTNSIEISLQTYAISRELPTIGKNRTISFSSPDGRMQEVWVVHLGKLPEAPNPLVLANLAEKNDLRDERPVETRTNTR